MKKKRPITNMSTKHLEGEGFYVTTVERKLTPMISKDAFGIGDLLAYYPDRENPYYGTWLIQVTDSTHHADRRKKAFASEHLLGWLHSQGRFAVLSFDKQNRPRWEELTVEAATYASGGPAPMTL